MKQKENFLFHMEYLWKWIGINHQDLQEIRKSTCWFFQAHYWNMSANLIIKQFFCQQISYGDFPDNVKVKHISKYCK